MGLTNFRQFNNLFRKGHRLADMGLLGSAGDVTRLSYRLRLARSFHGLKLEGVSAKATKGYEAFLLVFLTHSALELYLKLTGQALDQLESVHVARGSVDLIAEFFDKDKDGRLFKFLHKWLDSNFRKKLTACRENRCHNVGIVSAAIRHIFAHGYLTANANGINPEHVYQECKKVSEFLIAYMDDDFSRRMLDFVRRTKTGV
jgi:hypothetical protein